MPSLLTTVLLLEMNYHGATNAKMDITMMLIMKDAILAILNVKDVQVQKQLTALHAQLEKFYKKVTVYYMTIVITMTTVIIMTIVIIMIIHMTTITMIIVVLMIYSEVYSEELQENVSQNVIPKMNLVTIYTAMMNSVPKDVIPMTQPQTILLMKLQWPQ